MEQNQGGKKYQYRIERDQWGVPHIWGKTDADAVYGLAQARAEDQFASIQEGFMTIKGRSAEMKGIKGIGADILVFLVFADCKLEEARKNDLSSEFITILEAAKNGLNDFAQNNRDKVQFKDLFPISEIDILKGYILFQTFTSGAIYELGKVAGNRMEKLPSGFV